MKFGSGSIVRIKLMQAKALSEVRGLNFFRAVIVYVLLQPNKLISYGIFKTW